MAKYKPSSREENLLQEPAVAYASNSDRPTFKALLGGKSFSVKDVSNKHQYISLIKEGVEKQSMDHLMDMIDISSSEMADIMHTSERTLRRYTANTKLNPEQSERVIELARLYTRGAEVFGSLNYFKEWMNKSVLAFGNKKPKEFLDTSVGIEILFEELGRIEHGIFA